MFDHHRFGRDFSLNPQRKFLLLLCLWRGLGHKRLHTKFHTYRFVRLAACRSCKSDLSECSQLILGQKYVLSVEWHCSYYYYYYYYYQFTKKEGIHKRQNLYKVSAYKKNKHTYTYTYSTLQTKQYTTKHKTVIKKLLDT